ncbi:hypothetical protein [Scytonema sp. PCC 10023]|uniref:hypothetical protein n=1 Tax=Scytonema sp. PCC 10023 TaxID=1680591 RepID=UPI0039C757D7
MSTGTKAEFNSYQLSVISYQLPVISFIVGGNTTPRAPESVGGGFKSPTKASRHWSLFTVH